MSRKLACLAGESALRHVTKYVLEILADISDQEGRNCYPAVGYVAWRTSLSDRAVQKAMGELRDFGIITVESRPGRSNLLTIHADKIPPAPPYHPRKTDNTWDPDQMETPEPDAPASSEGCTTCARGERGAPLAGDEGREGVNVVHPRGERGAGGGERRAPISGTYPEEYSVQREREPRAGAREADPLPYQENTTPDRETIHRAALEHWRFHRSMACKNAGIEYHPGTYDLQNMARALRDLMGENETRESCLEAMKAFLATQPQNDTERRHGYDASMFRGWIRFWLQKRSGPKDIPATSTTTTFYDPETRTHYTRQAYAQLQEARARKAAPSDSPEPKKNPEKPAAALKRYAEDNPGSQFVAQLVRRMSMQGALG